MHEKIVEHIKYEWPEPEAQGPRYHVSGGGYVDLAVLPYIYEIKPFGGVEDPKKQLNKYLKANKLLKLGLTPYHGVIDDSPPLIGIRINYNFVYAGEIVYSLDLSSLGFKSLLTSFITKSIIFNTNLLTKQVSTAIATTRGLF